VSEPAPLRRGLPSGGGVSAAADRRFRRSTVRPGKRRSWRAGLRRTLLLAGGAAAILALAVWAVVALTYASLFRIDRILVRGNDRLAVGEVRALLDGIDRESIFHVNLEEYRLRVLDSPWVAQATLWRVLPSTVEVRVIERVPIAIARLNRQSYLVDSTGSIIDEAGPHYREFDLPIVDGLLTGEANGTVADPQRVELIERLVGDLSVRDDLLRRVSQVDVSDPRNAVVLLDGEPARLYLGDREFLARLTRYEEAATAVREHLSGIDYYDLRFDRPFVGSLSKTGTGR
jgi:cell division protein FtsQ